MGIQVEGGNPTNDRIFCLSLEEVIQYFGDEPCYITDETGGVRPALWLKDS